MIAKAGSNRGLRQIASPSSHSQANSLPFTGRAFGVFIHFWGGRFAPFDQKHTK
jgi:hypothetical protein